MSEQATKVCSRCKQEKPLAPVSAFCRRNYRNGTASWTADCLACRYVRRAALAQTERGREMARRNQRKHYQKLRERARFAAAIGDDEAKLDLVRRALVEKPPSLEGEDASLAYFRGFMAGSKRSSEESSKIEAVKDVIHRIASEQGGKHGEKFLSYEDALSSAYMAALEAIRSRQCPEDPIALRKMVSVVIRRRLVDTIRETHGRPDQANKLHVTLATNLKDDEENEGLDGLAGPVDSPERLGEALDGLHGLDGRDRQILELVSRGLLLREVGSRLGISESRVSQVLREIREAHPELEERLAC